MVSGFAKMYGTSMFSSDKKLFTETSIIYQKAAEFALDLLVTNKDGYLVTSPSNFTRTIF
jgi:hypothetical protein